MENQEDNELIKDESYYELLNLAARLAHDPNDKELKKDPLFIEKKALVLELLEVLCTPKIREEGGLRYAFPLLKEQKILKECHERISGAD